MRAWILLGLIATAFAKHEQYIGWKTFFVGPKDEAQLKTYGSIIQELDIDMLGHANIQREGLALVEPTKLQAFTNLLDDHQIAYRIHAEDIKSKLDYDDMRIEAIHNATARSGARIPYTNYQTWDVIEAYLDDIAARYPETVTLVNAGQSFEGRNLKYLKISTTNFEDKTKPVIVIDGGIHAREWISPPTVTWAIKKLVEDVTEPDLLERFDWILFPVVNPDGYSFTFTNNRFWRKTRSTDQTVLGFMCPGVDGNRNYDFFWNTVGTSANPCADTFAGGRAFSEVEVRAVRDIVLDHLERISLYITMHSFGSMILYPWGHDGSLSNNALGLHTVGIAMADAIHTKALSHFPRYVVGNSVLVIGYAASGAAEDWAHSVGVPFSYTYELPGLDSGLQGFVLDPRYIQPVCEETWLGIVAGARVSGNYVSIN